MPETIKLIDPKTYDWMQDHEWAEITVTKCDKCGMHYKPELGHVCDKLPRLEFYRKIGNIEIRTVNAQYAIPKLQNIEVVLWQRDSEGKPYCFTIMNWKREKEGYALRFIGERPFLYLTDDRVPELWKALREAQDTLDAWFDETEED